MLLILRILSTPWWAPFAAVYGLRRLRDRARRAGPPARAAAGLPESETASPAKRRLLQKLVDQARQQPEGHDDQEAQDGTEDEVRKWIHACSIRHSRPVPLIPQRRLTTGVPARRLTACRCLR